jgi:uncharacterized delta-60 repeat protein
VRTASARVGGSATNRHVVSLTVLTAAALALAGPGIAGPAGAWPGDPDGTFGSCGVRPVDASPGAASAFRAVAATSGAAVVGAGAGDDRGLIARLTAGVPDAGFGVGGLRLVKYSTPARFDAVAATASGGAVAAGRRTLATGSDTVVARVNATGGLDTSFHGTGKISADLGGTDAATAVAVGADGSVYVGGNAGSGGYVLHYTAAGAPDTGWSGDGKATGLPLSVRALALSPDGSLLVGGATTPSPGDWRILRLAADGTIDSAFGGATGRTVDLGGHDVITALARQADGAVIATGPGGGASGAGKTVVRRFSATGGNDPAFTTFTDRFGTNDTPVSVGAQSDGTILVAVNSMVGSDNDVVLLRLDADGTADPDFGIDGATVSDLGRRTRVAGAVAPAGQAPVALGTVRQGRDLAAVLRYQADGSSGAIPAQGFTADAYGGIHPWSVGCLGGPTGVTGNPYWPGWDIVRGTAALPGSRGIEVDAYGAVHGFTWGDGAGAVPVAHGTPYWPGWDIVRGVAVLPDGTGGYELDGYGGLHPFSIGSGATPPALVGTPYWNGFDIARGIALMPDGKGGYVVDGNGNITRFGGAPAVNAGAPKWPGQDIVRGIVLSPDGSGGWILDALGGLHPFGTGGDPAPGATVGAPYWGSALARGAAALPS